jgi:hypothetical protein
MIVYDGGDAAAGAAVWELAPAIVGQMSSILVAARNYLADGDADFLSSPAWGCAALASRLAMPAS